MPKKNKVGKQLKKEDKKAIKKQIKATKKSVKLGKKAARFFGKFYRVVNKLDEVGLKTFTDRIAKKNKCKISVTPINKSAKTKSTKVTKKAK